MALGLGSGIHSGFIGDECNWFKAVYPGTNQNSGSGIEIPNVFSGESSSFFAAFDTWTITCKMYLTGSGGTWDNSTDDVTTSFTMGSVQAQTVIPQNQITDISVTSPAMNSNWPDNMFVWWGVVGDYPDAAATFYISDLKIVAKDSGGNIKGEANYNFSSSEDISMIVDYSVDGGVINKTKGNCSPA